MRYERFIDRTDKEQLIASSSDFKARTHGLPSKWTIYGFALVVLAVIILIVHMSIRLILLPYDSPTPLWEVFGFLFTTSFLIIGIAVFSSIIVKKIRRYITETEFQSLLFASSVSTECDFFLISNKDKITVYFDYHFSELFPCPQDSSQLDILLTNEGLKDSDKNKLSAAIVACKEAKIPMKLTLHNGKLKDINIVVSPLSRPSGYSIIKGVSKVN